MDTLVICPNCESLNRVPFERGGHAKAVCGNCKEDLPVHAGVQELTGGSLGALLRKTSRPVVVDFWAPWCGPCRAFAPVYETAARELAGRMILAKLDTEASPLAGDTYQIRGVPTLLVFHDGAEVGRQSGAMPLPALMGFLGQFLGGRG